MATFHFPELQGGGETCKQQRLEKQVLEARPPAVKGTPQAQVAQVTGHLGQGGRVLTARCLLP